ncbi:MAG TPA: GTP-binding protein [Thermomicrobiales bacterium]|nr:GTP-binding protein [Thermomicrobiales bacterium]
MGLFERARAGEGQALARLASLLENDDRATLAALDALGVPEKHPHVIGLTGPPGAGKSSLINVLLPELARCEGRIAVLLIDPSSQATGGAVLGDRVRMLEWGDQRIYIRSQATRGQEGGLAPSTGALIDLFAHLGFDQVLIETVGVGQDGIDIRAVAQTTVVIQSPHAGDGVQALKAGILEIADIFVVSKADLPGAHGTVRDLNAMLHLIENPPGTWVTPVVAVSANEGTGVKELAEAIAGHRAQTGPGDRSQRLNWETEKRAAAVVRRIVRTGLPASLDRRERLKHVFRMALTETEQP